MAIPTSFSTENGRQPAFLGPAHTTARSGYWEPHKSYKLFSIAFSRQRWCVQYFILQHPSRGRRHQWWIKQSSSKSSLGTGITVASGPVFVFVGSPVQPMMIRIHLIGQPWDWPTQSHNNQSINTTTQQSNCAFQHPQQRFYSLQVQVDCRIRPHPRGLAARGFIRSINPLHFFELADTITQ